MTFKKELISKMQKIPLLSNMINLHSRLFFRNDQLSIKFPEYWENRYALGGNSGSGSYGKLQAFKAYVINSFIQENNVKTIIEFGCGDGNQLSSFNFSTYIGLDISKTAVQICQKKFKGDTNKIFQIYDFEHFDDNIFSGKLDVSLSLDVIYHIIDDRAFEIYMRHLFSIPNRYVVIYSTNFNSDLMGHIRHRLFTKWVEDKLPDWQLINRIKNLYPQETKADFFIYKRKSDDILFKAPNFK